MVAIVSWLLPTREVSREPIITLGIIPAVLIIIIARAVKFLILGGGGGGLRR